MPVGKPCVALPNESWWSGGVRYLTSSVRNRLVADVPVGAFLSGGLDSSLIVASMVACRRPDEPTYTFSVGFAGDRDSELPHARRVADALGRRTPRFHSRKPTTCRSWRT